MRANCSRSIYIIQVHFFLMTSFNIAHQLKGISKFALACPTVFGFCAGSLDVGDAPASYSLAWKFSWAPIHELTYDMSMPLDLCFIFPAGIFNWMALPLDQIFKVLLLPGPLAHSFVQYALHLWIIYNWHLLCPLDHWLLPYFLRFIWVQIRDRIS